MKELTKAQIFEKIICPAIEDFRSGQNVFPSKIQPSLELFGSNGVMDSIDFINFLLEIETRVEEQFAVVIRLTDEKAFSMGSNPFKTIDSLVDHMVKLFDKDRQFEQNI